MHGCLFLKKFTYQKNATYPDFGVNFETYTANEFLEMESLGPLTALDPGASVCHEESWSVYSDIPAPEPQDELALDAALAPYVEG